MYDDVLDVDLFDHLAVDLGDLRFFNLGLFIAELAFFTAGFLARGVLFGLFELFFFERIRRFIDHDLHKPVEVLHILKVGVDLEEEECRDQEDRVEHRREEDRAEEWTLDATANSATRDDLALLHQLEKDVDAAEVNDAPIVESDRCLVDVGGAVSRGGAGNLGGGPLVDQLFAVELLVIDRDGDVDLVGEAEFVSAVRTLEHLERIGDTASRDREVIRGLLADGDGGITSLSERLFVKDGTIPDECDAKVVVAHRLYSLAIKLCIHKLTLAQSCRTILIEKTTVKRATHVARNARNCTLTWLPVCSPNL